MSQLCALRFSSVSDCVRKCVQADDWDGETPGAATREDDGFDGLAKRTPRKMSVKPTAAAAAATATPQAPKARPVFDDDD